MKRTYTLIFLLFLIILSNAQKKEDHYFQLTDSVFSVGDKCKIQSIYFDLTPWDLRPEEIIPLNQVAGFLTENQHVVIEIGSHTDFRGSLESNDTLSVKRAEYFKEYIVKKGISKERIISKGYGERQPARVDSLSAVKFKFLPEGQLLDEKFIKSLTTVEEQEVAHELNRRTEIKILSISYNIE